MVIYFQTFYQSRSYTIYKQDTGDNFCARLIVHPDILQNIPTRLMEIML